MTEQEKPGSGTAANADAPDSPDAQEARAAEAGARESEAQTTDSADPEASSTVATDASAMEPAGADSGQDAAIETQTPAASGSGRTTVVVAWLALLVAVAGAGFSGYRWWLERTADNETADLESALESAISDVRGETTANAESLAGLERRISSLQQSLQEAADADRVARLEREFGQSRDVIESLPGRMQNLEESMANLQGISAGARDSWLVAEAEYYMQLANAQAQLAGNAELAAFALELADRRIRELGDPVYTPVRRQLADEIAALRAVEDVDVEGVSLTLASLADVVQSLRLDEDVTPEEKPAAEIDGELSGLERAWAAVKNAFSDMVSVRRSDEQLQPLLSPEAQYFLRTNIALQLQTARLALLKGEPAIFRQSLQDAQQWLERYFDTETKAVNGAIATLSEVRDSRVSTELPDISASLRLFRQQQAVAEGAE